MANNKPTTITTGEVRISYEHLLKPHANSTLPNAELKYSATLLIPKHDTPTKQRVDAAIRAAIQEGVSTKWGGAQPPQVPLPIYDGDGVRPSDGMPFGDECKGHWVMRASSNNRQEIVDLNLQPIMAATEIYSGMYARVNVNFFAYANAGKKGIGCGLGPVQKLRDGEPLAGGVSAEEAFSDGFTAPPPAPGYSQPAYPQQPYAAPGYPQQPAQPWHTPGYPAAPAAPAYPQQPVVPFPGPAPQSAAQMAGQINPITGQPYAQAVGGVMGI